MCKHIHHVQFSILLSKVHYPPPPPSLKKHKTMCTYTPCKMLTFRVRFCVSHAKRQIIIYNLWTKKDLYQEMVVKEP